MSEKGVNKRALADALLDKAQKVLRRTNSEETASKKCRDNLKGYTDPEVYIKKNEKGESMYDELLGAVRHKKINIKFALGYKFYRDLKLRHPKAAILGKALLVVPQPPQVVPPTLIQAMVATRLETPDHSRATVWINLNEP